MVRDARQLIGEVAPVGRAEAIQGKADRHEATGARQAGEPPGGDPEQLRTLHRAQGPDAPPEPP